jgi:hypothetical protein
VGLNIKLWVEIKQKLHLGERWMLGAIVLTLGPATIEPLQ